MGTVTQTMTPEELERFLDGFGDKLPETLRVVLKVHLQALVRSVVTKKLSQRGRRTLGVVTGAARRSAQATPVKTTADMVYGAFGSPLGYVRAHELGFHGEVSVKAHTRRLVKITKNARTGQLTKAASARVSAAQAAGRKTETQVKAHSRQVHMRARRMFSDTLEGGRHDLEERVARGLLILARTGRPPKPAQVMGVGGA